MSGKHKRGTFILVLRGKRWEFRAGMTVRDAMVKAGISPEGVLPVRDGKLITDDTIVSPGDEIRLVSVISGG